MTISGAGGGLGHLAVQYALAIGLRVAAIDTGAEKRKLLESYGVDKFIDFRDYKDASEIIAAVKETCDGLGPHARPLASLTKPLLTEVSSSPGRHRHCYGS